MVAPSMVHVLLAVLVSCLQQVLAYPVAGPPLSSPLALGPRDDASAVTYTPSVDSNTPSVLVAAAATSPQANGAGLVLINSLSGQPIPVARPSLLFLFTVSFETFSVPLDSVDLTTSTLPSWLTFSPESKAFTGTPANTDAGRTTITVTAKARNGGATVVDSFQLLVKAGNGVKAGDGVAGQLRPDNQALTSVFVLPVDGNGLGGVRVPNFWSFSMGFLASTFKSTSSAPVRYSAFLSSGARLPPWLTFDAASIDFNGNAPGPSAVSSFNVLLCGSDVAGYADYCEHFNLVVAAHALTFQGVGGQSTTLQRFNLTAEVGTKLEVGWDVVGVNGSKGLLLDGKSVNTSDITSVKVDTSSIGWLAWDETARTFSGNVPLDGLTDGLYPTSATKNSNSKLSVPVTVVDKYSNSLQLQLPISIYPSLFPSTAALPILAAPGQPVSADLAEYLTPTTQSTAKMPGLSVVFNPQSASSWLSFTPATSYLASTPNVPDSLDYDSVDVILTARDLITNATSHQTILLSIAPGNNATHGRPHRSAAAALDMRGRTIIGAVFGTLAGIILLCLLLSCCRKHCSVEKHQVDEQKTAEEHGWKDDEANAYGKEQMYGLQFNTEKYAYGNSYGKSAIGQEQLDGVPHLTRIFMDIAKESDGAVAGQQPETPLSRRSTTTTAGKFRQIVKKPFFAGMMGGRSREGSPTSGGGLKSNISLPVELSRSASPSSTLNEFDNPRRIGTFNGGGDGDSTVTGTSGGDGSTFGGPGSRASWESEPSYQWEDGSQGTASSAVASTPRRRFDANNTQSGDLMNSSSSHGSLDSHDTGGHSASSLDDHEERAEIAQAQRVGMATPTTRSGHDMTSSPTGSSSTTQTKTGIPRLVDFKNERTVQSSQGHRSISHSAVTINQPSVAVVATTNTARSKVGVPPLPYDAEAQFRFSAGLTYIPNMNAGESNDDGHSPSTSAIFFTSPPATYSASQIPRLSSPPKAKLASNSSLASRTTSLDSSSASPKAKSKLSKTSASPTKLSKLPTVPSSTTNKIARIPSDAQIVFASTTEAFSFRPSLDIDADKPLRGMLKAVVEGAEESPRKGKGLKRLPPWLKFNKGLFDGVPKIGDEGRVDIRVIESFSGLGGQAERVVARFAIEVQTGSQITRRATGRRPNLPGVSTKSP